MSHSSVCMFPAGLVQSWSSVCLRWVLRSLWCSRLSSAFMLPERPAGEGGERSHDRPHPAALQLCILCFSRPWKQVRIKSLHACPVFFTFSTGTVLKVQVISKRANPLSKCDTTPPYSSYFMLGLVSSCIFWGVFMACSLFFFSLSFFPV